MEKGELKPTYIPTDSNIADSFTKPVKKATLEEHYSSITGLELACAN